MLPRNLKIIVSGTVFTLKQHFAQLPMTSCSQIIEPLENCLPSTLGLLSKVLVKERRSETQESTIVWVNLHKGSVEWKIGNDVHLRYTLWGFSLDQCLCGMSSLTFPVVLGNALGLCQCHSPALLSTTLWKS